MCSPKQGAITRLKQGGKMMTYGRDPFETLGLEIDKMFRSTNIPKPTYPPYNLIKWTEDKLTLEFALAGFAKKDIEVTENNGWLIVRGNQQEEAADIPYVRKGIGARKFIRQFELLDHLKVDKATFENGILTVDLIREVPEDQKPKEITIN
jgi:molecular chaperone IbpA